MPNVTLTNAQSNPSFLYDRKELHIHSWTWYQLCTTSSASLSELNSVYSLDVLAVIHIDVDITLLNSTPIYTIHYHDQIWIEPNQWSPSQVTTSLLLNKHTTGLIIPSSTITLAQQRITSPSPYAVSAYADAADQSWWSSVEVRSPPQMHLPLNHPAAPVSRDMRDYTDYHLHASLQTTIATIL